VRLLPLMQANFIESNPIPVKYVMAEMGLVEARYRLPLVPPRAETKEKLSRVMQDLGLARPSEARA
jgi:4-hydroxy-tetrahydrodipicolinate synthase